MYRTVLLFAGLLLTALGVRAQNPPPVSEPAVLTHEVRYAPHDGSEVYLAWKPTDRPVAELLRVNTGVRQIDSLIYTPMVAGADGFTATIALPVGTEYYFCFWVTKSGRGDYTNFWDVQAGGYRSTTDAASFRVSGTAQSAAASTSRGWHPAWLVALLMVVVYWVIWQRGLIAPDTPPYPKILSTGLALSVVHLIARAQILEIDARALYRQPVDSVVQITAASTADLTFVGGLTAVALLILGLFRGRSPARTVGTVFTGVALLATFACLLNVAAVNYLGHPFTYQWLYYSGFIMSPDAAEAFKAYLTAATAADLLSYPLILLLGAACLSVIGRSLPPWVLPLTLIVLITGSAYTATRLSASLDPGRTANGVTTFLSSMWSADEPDSFVSRSLTPDQLDFSEVVVPSRVHAVPDSLQGRVKNLLLIVLESAGGVYFNRFAEAIDPASPLAAVRDRSLVFDRVYAHSPSTNCSMVSLLSGIYPQLSYRSLTQESPDLEFPSLASILSERGYRTGFFSSADQAWLSSREYLEAREFDVVEDYRDIQCDRQFRLAEEGYKEASGVDDACLADRFVAWREEEPDRPFFSMLWTLQGHYPYYYAGEEADYGVEDFLYNRYLNAVRHGTEVVVEVLNDLKRSGLDSTTLVVLTGDHGEAFGQHGHYGHGNTLYEEDLRVPLYFINPLLFDGDRHAGLGNMKDVAPTALQLLGVEPPEAWQGRDLLSTASEEGFYFAPWTNLYFGYRRGDRKYIFNETTATVEVFDLASDPQERHDLSAQTPSSEIDSVRIRLAAWVQRQDAFYKAIH